MLEDIDAVEVRITADGSGLIADSIRLSNETVQRSELLQNVRESCVGSAEIPIQPQKFRLWCSFEADGSSWADLVSVMEVRAARQSAVVPLTSGNVHCIERGGDCLQTSRFLQDSTSHAEACREFASDIRRAVRVGYSGHVADKISDIPAPGNAALLGAAGFDKDLISHLLAMGDHSLSSVLKQVSMHDIALLPNGLRMRSAALTARLADGTLSLSGALAVGADDMREGYPCQSMFREYAPFIEQLQLRRLDLARNGLGCDDGIALLHVLSNQPHLHHLDLSGNTDPTPDAIIPAVSVASALTFLSLAKCMEYNAREPVLRPISHLSHLAHLDILGCQISTSELKEIDDIFANFTALTQLQMGSFPELDVGAAAALTHHLPPCMRHLTLSWGQNVSLAQTNYATLPDGLLRLTALSYLCLGDPDPDSIGKYGLWPPEHATLNSVFATLATLPHLSHFLAPMLRAPPRVLAHLAGATRLRHLTLAPNLDANFSDLSQLTSLHVRDDPSATPGSRWCHLRPLTALRRLNIHKFIASLPAVQGLSSGLGPASAALQDLEIDAYSEDPEAPQSALVPRAACAVPLLTQLTHLTRLVVKDWDACGAGPKHLARVLATLRLLCHLHVTGVGEHPSEAPAPISFAPMSVWAPWGGFGDATGAGGDSGGGAGDGGAVHSSVPPGADLGRALAPLTALTALRLHGLFVADMGEVVAALGTLRALRHLELTECHMRADEAGTLAALLWRRAFPLLEVLDLGNNDLTAAGVGVLAGGLRAARRLRELRIPGLGGHTFERPRNSYMTEDDDDDEDDTMTSDDDGGSEASGDVGVVLVADAAAVGESDGEEAGAAGVGGSDEEGDEAEAVVLLSEGSVASFEEYSSDGSGGGAQGGASGGGDGGVGGVAGVAVGVAGAAVGVMAELGAALMMAMAVMAAGGPAAAGNATEDGSSVGSSVGMGIPGGSGHVPHVVALSDEFDAVEDEQSDGGGRGDRAHEVGGAGAGDAGSAGGCVEGGGSGGAGPSSVARVASDSGTASGGRGTPADGSLPELLGSSAAGSVVSLATAVECEGAAAALHVPAAASSEPQDPAAALQAAMPAMHVVLVEADAEATAAEMQTSALLVSAAPGPWSGAGGEVAATAPSGDGTGSMADDSGAAGAGAAEQQPVHEEAGGGGVADAVVGGGAGVAASNGAGASADGAEAVEVSVLGEGAWEEDEDVPWWQHEPTAELLWQALLRLPLDRGVDL